MLSAQSSANSLSRLGSVRATASGRPVIAAFAVAGFGLNTGRVWVARAARTRAIAARRLAGRAASAAVATPTKFTRPERTE